MADNASPAAGDGVSRTEVFIPNPDALAARLLAYLEDDDDDLDNDDHHDEDEGVAGLGESSSIQFPLMASTISRYTDTSRIMTVDLSAAFPAFNIPVGDAKRLFQGNVRNGQVSARAIESARRHEADDAMIRDANGGRMHVLDLGGRVGQEPVPQTSQPAAIGQTAAAAAAAMSSSNVEAGGPDATTHMSDSEDVHASGMEQQANENGGRDAATENPAEPATKPTGFPAKSDQRSDNVESGDRVGRGGVAAADNQSIAARTQPVVKSPFPVLRGGLMKADDAGPPIISGEVASTCASGETTPVVVVVNPANGAIVTKTADTDPEAKYCSPADGAPVSTGTDAASSGSPRIPSSRQAATRPSLGAEDSSALEGHAECGQVGAITASAGFAAITGAGTPKEPLANGIGPPGGFAARETASPPNGQQGLHRPLSSPAQRRGAGRQAPAPASAEGPPSEEAAAATPDTAPAATPAAFPAAPAARAPRALPPAVAPRAPRGCILGALLRLFGCSAGRARRSSSRYEASSGGIIDDSAARAAPTAPREGSAARASATGGGVAPKGRRSIPTATVEPGSDTVTGSPGSAQPAVTSSRGSLPMGSTSVRRGTARVGSVTAHETLIDDGAAIR